MKETLSPVELQMAETLWPKSFFASHDAWLTYVEKWFPIITKSK